VVPYIFAQCLGAALAAGTLKLSLDPILFARTNPETVLDLGVTRAIDGQATTVLLWEFLLTFALMFVVMGVATDYRAVSKAAGIAIGGTVWFEAMFAGPICRASMNPARSIGPAIVAWDLTNLWAYIVAPIAGALAGAWTYQYLRGPEPDSPRTDT
jgi:glycerol uptake facilitator-like aquaporin